MADRAIDKVRKLLAQAESAQQIGNQAEAEAFTARADELMLKYKLELTDLEVDELVAAEIGAEVIDWYKYGMDYSNRRCGWLEMLAYVVCDANACRFAVTTGTNRLTICGSEANRTLCCYLIGSLARFAIQEEPRAWRRVKSTFGVVPPKFKQGFLLGFVRAIAERYKERRTQQWTGTHALVVVDREAAAVNDWMDDQFGKSVADSVNVGSAENGLALAQGFDAGRSANLDAIGDVGRHARKGIE